MTYRKFFSLYPELFDHLFVETLHKSSFFVTSSHTKSYSRNSFFFFFTYLIHIIHTKCIFKIMTVMPALGDMDQIKLQKLLYIT